MKNKGNGTELIKDVSMLIAAIVYVISLIIILCSSGCSHILKTKGFFELDRYLPEVTVNSTVKIQRIPGMDNSIPGGYEFVASADFKTGLITTQCSETFLLDQAVLLCKKVGVDAYKIVEMHDPDMITNTCYRAKIILLKKKQ